MWEPLQDNQLHVPGGGETGEEWGCKRRAAGYRLKHFRNITTKCNGPSLCADWNKASVKDILKIFQKILSQIGLFNDTQELSLILLSVTMVL